MTCSVDACLTDAMAANLPAVPELEKADDLATLAATLVGRPVTALTSVTGGANSRVYRAATAGKTYALKLYPAGHGDGRDRLGAETTALAFLARHGVDCVPTLVAFHRNQAGFDWAGMAAFGWVNGGPVNEIGPAEIDAALGFLNTLHRLRNVKAVDLPAASEACLSPDTLLRQVKHRHARLSEVADAPRTVLDKAAALMEISQAAIQKLPGFTEDLPFSRRTLSPSDFGFHNALRRPDGRIVFLDFEYFGWDDPVKLTADVLLHPGMTLTGAAKRRFADGAQALYGADDPDFARRLAALMPLYALRWCMIVLNEFLPERWAHRVQAGLTADRETMLNRQLTKARAFLEIAHAHLYGEPA